MNFQKKKKEKKVFNRFVVGLVLLLTFSLAGFYRSIKIEWPNSFHEGVLAPIPLNDPLTELENKLLERDISISFPLVATESAILGNLVDGGEVWFARDKDLDFQVDSLQMILSQLKIEGKKIKKIDFRYERPTVVY